MKQKSFSAAGWLTGLDVWKAGRGESKGWGGIKREKMHTTLCIWLESLQLDVSSVVGAMNYLLNIPHVKSETHQSFSPPPPPSNTQREKPALVWWVSSPVFFFFFATQKGAEVNFHWKATTVRHIFHSHQQYGDTASAVNRLQNSQTGWRECKHTHTHARLQPMDWCTRTHSHTKRWAWTRFDWTSLNRWLKKKIRFFSAVMFCCNKIKLFA